ncbi:hypothetical protein [Salinicola rhizosphaerae]|uniref:Uncharacterized protein n=1 Tax=Salinicola rhizosphaerae TaxID=1443141 RepID=A0ABQ3E8G3_9GAMM|nr:hypothetical protein [Salinicola rhizosphaerae]GHB29516.1 hypothetical protein GCM10009038_30220 [Salinicola rhizosphaerae]
MSVINRIEIANLLNKHGDIASPWEAKMRHLLLDLRGQSSAISMENGFGKTTMAEALIGMLSRDRQLLTRTRRKCSPSKVNGEARSWTHLRVEFRAQEAERQDDILAAAGDEVAGETFVFGMYGYSDGSGLVFYHYPGQLADVPVHHITRDGKLALYPNADFQSTMRANGVTRASNREEWLEAVGAHISRRELAQLAAFQKEGGADKSQIFNAIKPRAGEKADQAFFYEVLAPQILSGATRGETDEEEELIEDVILNSGTRITELRHRLAEAESDQQRADDKVERLATLNEEGESLLESRRQLGNLDASLEEAERLLGGQALAPLAGLPGRSSIDADAESTAEPDSVAELELAAGLAWAIGDTERPRVSTWLLAKLSRQAERNVRQALSERGARVDTHRRLVHLPQASWIGGREVGHVAFDQARAWLADSHAFSDDAARYRALSQLDNAVEAFEALDGNRFREEVIADREYRRSLKLDAERLDDEIEGLEHEREQLESRQRDFIDNQSVYTQALAEGLFSEAELETPEATRDGARQTLEVARRQHADHLGRMGELKQPAQWHAAFVAEHADITPEALLETKQAQQAELETQLADWEEEASTLLGQRDGARQAVQSRREQRQRLEGEMAPLAAGREAWQTFAENWPDASPVGFWSARRSALASHEQALADARRAEADAGARLARLEPLEDSASRYRQWHGDASPVHLRDTLYRQSRELQDGLHQLTQEAREFERLREALSAFREISEQTPGAWLKDAKARYPRLLRERETLAGASEARERYLESLSGDPLARLAAETEAQQLLDDKQIEFQVLHEVIAGLEADAEQRRLWLAQAAGQLFAPVIEGEAAAREASQCLIDAGCGVPVLEAASLAATLARGELPLGAVQGVETLAVKAALDPAYLTALREETQQRLEIDRQRQQALEDEIARLDPHGERFRLALEAQQAIADDAEVRLAALDEKRDRLEAEQSALAPRLGEAALKAIDDFQRFLEEGGESALAEAREARAAAVSERDRLSPLRESAARELEQHGDLWLAAERFAAAGGIERLAEIDEQLSLLDEESAEFGERLAEIELQVEALESRRGEGREQLRRLFDDGERDRLRRLATFVAEGGPEFMRDAETREADLQRGVADANRRADFDFDRIRAFLQVRDEKGGNRTLERDIGRLKQSLKESRDRRKANGSEQSTVETRLGRHQQALNVVDQLAVAWLEVLRQLPEGWAERALADPDAGWPRDGDEAERLDAALASWRQWLAAPLDPEAAGTFELEALETCQQTLLEGLGALNLGERARNRERQARDVTARERALGLSLESASASRLFNETERARLGSLEGVSPEALESLRSLHAQLVGQLDEHRARVGRLHTSREQIEDTLVERLSSIIIDAAGNLEILRRVAQRASDGGAYFEVKAALIADDDVRELIQQLLADIDAHLAVQRRRIEQAGDKAQARGGSDDELTRQIRRRIYRGLFRDVTIRIKHEAIRPHGRLFSLNEDMSEGQREAVSLMWLVKLSEFAIERELRELPGAQKRRARVSRESVILLDGLFSKLSHRRLIQDSLESLRNTRGRFQMIGLIHNPNYENDPGIFPTYLVGSVIGGQQGQGGHVMVRDGQLVEPEETGRGSGEASLFGIHVTPAPVE